MIKNPPTNVCRGGEKGGEKAPVRPTMLNACISSLRGA